MNIKIWFSSATLICLCGFFYCVPAHAESASIRVDNLEDDQEITESVPAQFRILTSAGAESVKVYSNGVELGQAEPQEAHPAQGFAFSHEFDQVGDHDLIFEAYNRNGFQVLARQKKRVKIVPKEPRAPSRYFNRYILKAVAHLSKNWGLLGYDINKQLTHPIDYNKLGTLMPTGNGLTMCVSGVLETILTAFEIYSKEVGNKKVYSFLPFESWNNLRPTSIKAHIWVNPKLNSSGTADALAKFGLGENVKFKDLEPGSFININRTTGTGHAVVFLSFIDIKGKDLAKYSDKVAGFRYFGAQGRRVKGKGGFSYRHAFFSKNGCPEVPYQRDCNVIFSESQKMLNTGMMYHPANWKQKSLAEEDLTAKIYMDPENEQGFYSPAEFNGLTTDD